jgi:hypothetical protein
MFWCGITEGKSKLGRPRIRWEENITMGNEETGWEGVEWNDLRIGLGGQVL